ncbi:MAG TPA: molybdopterin-dependent oxidoreductase [Gemmatimonadales bacterium]|jgi:molybdopterin-containing oxidoreductase family iron-sulfur binding subunit
MDRRRFLKVLGVTGGGAAALTGCGIGPEPTEQLVPYVVPPENQVPGIATFYATTCRECAAGCGLHAKVREGRVIKLEGNPESPINHGRLCARGQAALQGLYNPDRVTDPMARAANGDWQKLSWDDALARLQAKLQEARGKGIAFVTGLESGSFGALVDTWTRQVGGRHVTYEPFAFEALRAGNRMAFGTPAVPWYDFASARYIVSFGADFMETWLSPVGYQNAFTRAHAFSGGRDASMAKFVYVGPRLALTGMSADQWIAAAPGTEGMLALAMAQVIVARRLAPLPPDVARVRAALDANAPERVAATIGIEAEVITRLAREFAASRGGLAVAGGIAAQYPNGAEIVAAVNILNYVAGQVGKTVKFGPNHAVGAGGSFRELADLAADVTAGKVALLLVHGANPAHSLPAAFSQALAHARYRVCFASYLDETAAASDLVLPDLHPLEQWNDSEPRTGVYALQQPVMQPVFPNTRHAGDVLLHLAGRPGTFKDYLQGRWQELHRRFARARGFDEFWDDALQHGGLFTEAPVQTMRLALAGDMPALGWKPTPDQPLLLVCPSIALHDGRGANKPWLQELPDPVSKITWHAWVEVHPETAAKWQVANGDVLLLKSPHGALRAPVWITPGVRPDVLAIPSGQGHKAYGRYAKDRSFNAFELLSDAPTAYGGRAFAVSVAVAKTGDHRRLATLEGDAREQGRGVIEVLPLARAQQLKRGAHPFHERLTPPYADRALTEWAEAQHDKAALGDYARPHPRWGMAIDLAKCTGCSACVTACYAENNLATVGEELVVRRRQMGWLRIERYYTGGEDGQPVGAVVTPMLCQQCGNAPCEPVCPVYAAYHTADGLNGQVYNRCVGTRYCANNCPYKVRYFNWYNYAEHGGEWESWPDPLNMLLNPDVTVREKGVMEKCTFCVQRIRGAQNRARLEDRNVQDGDITPSCAQACPSEAIVFGDLRDPASRVAALARDPRGYHVLADLNTQPAITYLAKVVHGAVVEG